MRNDIAISDALIILVGYVIMIVHWGLIAPYANELMLREVGL